METTQRTSYLFVYGTLRRADAHPMHALLQPAQFVGLATIPGRLYDLGAYPGLIASDEANALVQGEVYLLANPSDTLARLDRYEGCSASDPLPHEYRRVERAVRLSDGCALQAWLYLYKYPVTKARLIPSGDWLDR